MMMISSFDDLLQAARQHPEPQRLLFVLAQAELPPDASAAERAAFEAGQGGALAPLMCVDKLPAEVGGWDAFHAEIARFGQPWRLLFVAAMSGRRGVVPSSADAEPLLNRMIESIKLGQIQTFLAFDRAGELVRFG